MISNFRYKLLALSAAVIFWFLIVGTQQTLSIYPQKLPIDVFNLSDDLAVVNTQGYAQLTLQGDSDAAKNISPSDFQVYVDAKGLKEGEYILPVTVSNKNTKIDVVKIIPTQIAVILESRDMKQIPIKIDIENEPAPFYQSGDPFMGITKVNVKGAGSVLAEIEQAYGIISLNGSEVENINKIVSLEARDSQGNEVSNSILDPDTVEVFLPIIQTIQTKIVPIQPDVEFDASDLQLKKIEAMPATVVITGQEPILSKISFIATAKIPLSSKQSEQSFETTLLLPEGINLLREEDNKVLLRIFIEKKLAKKDIRVPIKLLNNNSKLQSNHNSIIVGIEGAQSELAKIQETDGVMLIDIKNIQGTNVEIKKEWISLPSSITILYYEPTTITLVENEEQ